MTVVINKMNGRAGIILGAVLCVLLLYFPWGAVLQTGIAVPEYAGWGLFGVWLLVMTVGSPLVFHRSPLLLLAVLLLSLPLWWTAAQGDLWHAVMRVLALWGGTLVLLWLGARPLPASQAFLTAQTVVAVGVVCALSVLVRLFLPALHAAWLPLAGGGWATGGFLQPDLMALFLATAIAAGLQLWLVKKTPLMLPLLVVLSLALTLCQSLVADAGVLMMVLVTLVVCARGLRRWLLGGVFAIVAGALVAWLLMGPLHLPVVRPMAWTMMAAIFRGCLVLIAHHPLLGTGYGSFEGQLPAGMAMAGLAGIHPHYTVTHPGNELLLWVTEGGMVAAVGLLLLLGWGAKLAFDVLRQARRVGGYGHEGSDGLGWLLCALPLALSCLVGSPWYQSPLHYLLFLVFTGVALARLTGPAREYHPGRGVSCGLKAAMAVAGVAALWFTLSGVGVAVGVQNARQSMARDVQGLVLARQVNPWYLPDEVGFALTVNQLQQFNQTRDLTLLPPAEAFLRGYLQRHPDPNVYSMLITLLDKQGRSAEAEAVYQEGQRRVPWDKRFAPDVDATAASPHQ